MAQQEVIVRKREDIPSETMKTLIAAINKIKYGSITLVIQDGKLLQIDKTEKIRLK